MRQNETNRNNQWRGSQQSEHSSRNQHSPYRESEFEQSNDSNYGPEYGEMYPGARRNMQSEFDRAQPEQNRSSRGEFTGVGPKNFSRSKERILEDVNQKLTDHPKLDATDIEVDFDNGEIVLRGQVKSRECKRCAEDVAEQVPGVRDVRNELRVGRSGTARDEKSEKMEKGADSGTSKHRQNANNPDMRA